MHSRTPLYFLLSFIVVLALGGVLHARGDTFQVVDQIYCRAYYPWAAHSPKLSCPYRSGDDLFENDFLTQEFSYLSHNPHQHTFTERILTGYPIGYSYASNPYTLFRALNAFLPPYSSINFSALILLWIGFTLGYAIARSLEFSPGYAIFFGVLAISLSHVSLFETWNTVLLGHGFLILGMLLYYRHRRPYAFLCLGAAGASLILLSAIYQFYFYTVLNVILLAFWWRYARDRKQFFRMGVAVILLFVGAALVLNGYLENHIRFLLTSQKIGHSVPLTSLLEEKWISLDPTGWLSNDFLIAHRKGFEILHRAFGGGVIPRAIDFFQNKLQASTHLGTGVGFLVLVLVGAVAVWKQERGYVVMLAFWFLYFVGVLPLFLSFMEPFRSETSPRAAYLFYSLGAFAALVGWRGLAQGTIVPPRWLRLLVWTGLGYLGVLSLGYVLRGKLFFGNIPVVIASIGLCAIGFRGFTKHRQDPRWRWITSFSIAAALVLPTLAKLFFGFAPAVFSLHPSSLYYPPTEFGKLVQSVPLHRVALVHTPGGAAVEPNAPVRLGVRTITGFRNPLLRRYNDLYRYHQLLVEGKLRSAASFEELQRTSWYLNPSLYSWELPGSLWQPSDATKRYWMLHQVDGLIGSADLVLKDPDWKRLGVADGLSLWKRVEPPLSFFFARNAAVIPRSQELSFMFGNTPWDPRETVVLEDAPRIALAASGQKESRLELVEAGDGYRRMHVNTEAPGVLVFPVAYDLHWKAQRSHRGGAPEALRTAVADYAFLGVELPAGTAELTVWFDDKTKTRQWILSGMGVGVFVGLGWWLGSAGKNHPHLAAG